MMARQGLLGLALSLAVLTNGNAWASDAKISPEKSLPTNSAEKLPIDLPSVTIRGEDETAGPMLPGNKLSPDEPGAMAFKLPRPKTALDLDRYLAEASESVVPMIQSASESLGASVPGFEQLRLGSSGPNRYDLGAYLARSFDKAPAWLGGNVTTTGELDGLTSAGSSRAPDDWSDWSLRLKESSTATGSEALSTRSALNLEHRSTLVGISAGDAYAQGLDITAGADEGPYAFDFKTQASRVGTPIDTDADTYGWNSELGGTWHPDLGSKAHDLALELSLGERMTDRRNDTQTYLKAADDWTLRPDLGLNASFGVGELYGNFVADPGLALRYRPSDATELSAGVRSETEMPSFSELYLSRRYVAGNGALVDERIPLRLDLTATHRLGDRWHAKASASYLKADRWIAWREAAGGQGLWQPFNPGLSGDVGSRAQTGILGEVSAQYQSWEAGSQDFFYRWRSIEPLGEIAQEAGTMHHSSWLHGKLDVEIGGSILLQQLGLGQAQGATSTGWQCLLEGGATYQFTPAFAAYLRADALPLKQVQPAANFFAPDALAVAGVTVGF